MTPEKRALLPFSTHLQVYEKWDLVLIEPYDYLMEASCVNPEVVGRYGGQKTLALVRNQQEYPARQDFFLLSAVEALIWRRDEYFEQAVPLILSREELIWRANSCMVLFRRTDLIDYLQKRKLLATTDCLSAMISKYDYTIYPEDVDQTIKLTIDEQSYQFFLQLFKLGVRPSYELFSSPGWVACHHLRLVKLMVANGAKPDKSGVILAQFPANRDELVQLGFK